MWGRGVLGSSCFHHLQESPTGELKLLINLITAVVGDVVAMFSETTKDNHNAGAVVCL